MNVARVKEGRGRKMAWVDDSEEGGGNEGASVSE